MRNLIFGISCILLFGSFTSSKTFISEKETENCGCELTNNIETFITENPPKLESLTQQEELTEKEIKEIAGRLCSDMAQSNTKGFNKKRFVKIITKGIGKNEDDHNINIYVSNFLNKYKNQLICPKDEYLQDNRTKHLYKSAILKGISALFDEILLNEDEYEIDFNAYEIVNGKKETILDYLDKLILTENYDKKELQMIQMDIEDLGGKRGIELND